MNEKILIIEDDYRLRTGLQDNFLFEGYRVTSAPNAEIGEHIWFEIHPELVILDLMLPGRSGYELLRIMRAHGSQAKVIILSALGEEWDKVKGFRYGCDDYVVKPFSIMELLARVNAVLRRQQPLPESNAVITRDELTLRVTDHQLTCAGRVQTISELQTLLLSYFLRHFQRVISRAELLEKVWCATPDLETRTIDMHISTLRKLLSGSSYRIETVYKAGYRLIRDSELLATSND